MLRNCEEFINHCSIEIRKKTDLAVVGLSGGADSSLTAILCMKALGREHVFGVSMPYNKVDIKTFNSRSQNLAERIGINHLVRPVYEIVDAINRQIFLKNADKLTDINKGNSRSRARMCILYGLAHDISTNFRDKKVRVVGTGNLSEDFIGYDTKGGDALADFFPLGELFKSEVYQLLEYFKGIDLISEENIDRVPSAGLEENQTDEKDLGYTYAEMEKGIRYCLKNYNKMTGKDVDEVTAFVWQRHLRQKHKHEAPPVIKAREFCD